MHLAGCSIALAALFLVGGCSPTFDWREVRLASGMVALFPCRPQTHVRRLVIAGEVVTMELASCETGELTFAVGHLAVAEATQVESVKQVLRDALRINLSSPAPAAASAASLLVPATGDRLTVNGTGPEGKPLAAQSRIFNRSTSVFQATVIGRQLMPEPVEFFFASLKSPS